MPFEIEYKYVLDCLPCSLTPWMDLASKNSWDVMSVKQSYLDADCRIREISYIMNKGKNVKSKVEHRFTFKKIPAGFTFPIEIEKKIKKPDFDLLWNEGTKAISKIRFAWKEGKLGEWCVDFFTHHHDFYFCMAEFECKTDLDPNSVSMPDIISDHLLYVVEPGDKRFTSKKLSDVATARKLYEDLKHESTKRAASPISLYGMDAS